MCDWLSNKPGSMLYCRTIFLPKAKNKDEGKERIRSEFQAKWSLKARRAYINGMIVSISGVKMLLYCAVPVAAIREFLTNSLDFYSCYLDSNNEYNKNKLLTKLGVGTSNCFFHVHQQTKTLFLKFLSPNALY